MALPNGEIDPASLSNDELLAVVDAALLELERRLLRYAQRGHQIRDMADEGLVLAVRAGARLAQAQSAAGHSQGHLRVVGVGDWRPNSTRPSWDADPRILGRPIAEDGASATE